MNTKLFTMLCLITVALLAGVQPTNGQCADNDPSDAEIAPTIVSGNPDVCDKDPNMPGNQGGLRIDPPNGGTYNLDAYGNTVTVTISSTTCGQVFSWSVPDNIVIEQVVAKGGNQGANVYDYSGGQTFADQNLHAPRNYNTQNGEYSENYAGLSHIDFCYHYKLTIGKTATPTFTRTWDWSIVKECLGGSLTLADGEIYTTYPFKWTASANPTDSDWKVDGTITIANNTPFSATITSIADVLSGGIPATLSCPEAFPYPLLSGSSFNCTYTADPGGAINGTNTVTVETSTPLVEGGTATADYTFGDPTTLVDECIAVTDDCTVGTTEVCYNSTSFVKNYSCDIGPYPCGGTYSYLNTASFLTNDRKITGSDNCSVSITVPPCGQGCTLTPGYWKTHSEFGPAPYDDNWAQLPNGASTPFFLSGQSYYEVLWTPPAGGNAYYILAHAYIAAQLNFLNGADPTAAQTAFNAATPLFNAYTPAQVAAFKGPNRNNVINLATTLDNYNNGLIGPGHCDEDANGIAPSSSSGAVIGPMNELKVEKPTGFTLEQNYPNPFNPVTQIRFAVEKPGQAKLVVFNTLGEVVATLFDASAEAGRYYQVEFDASQLSSGIYFYRLASGDQVQVKKLLLVR